MNKIPTHNSVDKLDGEIAIIHYVSEDTFVPSIDYAYKDDNYTGKSLYLFIYIIVQFKKGEDL